MTRYRPGDIVLVRFPFTDLSASKKRPALVLSTPGFTARQGDVVVLAMTSQPQRDTRLGLSHWQSARLPKPTWVKPVIGTFAATLVIRRLGRLHPADNAPVRCALRQLIAWTFLR
jgi:mRNA interferase MazF